MRKADENEWNDHQRENALIMFWILSTSSLRKCMEISLENLHTDIGALRVNTISNWGFKETEVLRRWGNKTSNELSKRLCNIVFQFSQLRDWALVTILSLPIKYKTGFLFYFPGKLSKGVVFQESHYSSNIHLLAPSSCTAQHYKQYCYGRGLPVQKTYWMVPVCSRMPWFLNSRRRSAQSKCNFKPVSNPSRFPFLFIFNLSSRLKWKNYN